MIAFIVKKGLLYKLLETIIYETCRVCFLSYLGMSYPISLPPYIEQLTVPWCRTTSIPSWLNSIPSQVRNGQYKKTLPVQRCYAYVILG